MIDSLSNAIAIRIYRLAEPSPSVAVMKYALSNILIVVSTLLLSTLIGVITNSLWETLIAFTAFSLFRSITGGVHAKTLDHCVLMSTIIIAGIPHLPIPGEWTLLFNAFSAALVLLFAPSGMSEQFSKKKKFYYKVAAIYMIMTNCILCSVLVAKVLLVQSLTLISNGKEVIRT